MSTATQHIQHVGPENGGPEVTADNTKAIATILIDLAYLIPVAFAEPLLLTPQVTFVCAFANFLPADSPPIRLITCTFLF